MAVAHSNATVGELLEIGARVYWKCHECGSRGDADLERIRQAKGDDFRLCDRHPPCPTPGCAYWIGFYFNNGQVTAPMRTEAGLSRESDRRTAWLAANPHLADLQTWKDPPRREPERASNASRAS